MVTNAEPVDLALEMRAIKFTLDYDGAKKTEYGRLQRVESRVKRNLRRSRLRQRAKDKGLTDEVEPDELPSQEEIDVSAPYYLWSPSSDFPTSVPPVQPSISQEVGF